VSTLTLPTKLNHCNNFTCCDLGKSLIYFIAHQVLLQLFGRGGFSLGRFGQRQRFEEGPTMPAHSPARSWPPHGPATPRATYGPNVTPVIPGRPVSNPAAVQHYSVPWQSNPWMRNWGGPGGGLGFNDRATVVRSSATPVLAYRPPPSGPPFPPAPRWPPGPALGPLARPRGTRRRWWAVLGGVSAAVVAATVGTGLVVTAVDSDPAPVDAAAGPSPTSLSSSSPAPAPVVALSALPGLLLDTATINSIEGSRSIAVLAGGETALAYSGLDNDRPDCGEIQGPALQSALDNSGWVGVRTQSLSDPAGPNGNEHLINNAVIYYPSAQAANDFAAKQAEAWARCNGATLHTTSSSDPPSIWLVAPTTNEGGVLSVTTTQEGGGGLAVPACLGGAQQHCHR
jgi:hypothetical protein